MMSYDVLHDRIIAETSAIERSYRVVGARRAPLDYDRATTRLYRRGVKRDVSLHALYPPKVLRRS